MNTWERGRMNEYVGEKRSVIECVGERSGE